MWNASSTAGAAAGYYGHQQPSAGGLLLAQQQQPPSSSSSSSSAIAVPGQKHDVFVGNLAFATTEEQLHAAFSELGRVIRVRMVSDVETGKPRGFAFVEFEDPQAALSAIRNMNDYEINGRRLRVNFSNSSHLETLAGQLGMDLSHVGGPGGGGGGGGMGNRGVVGKAGDDNNPMGSSSGMMMTTSTMSTTTMGGMTDGGASMMTTSTSTSAGGAAGSRAVAVALQSMNRGEMYDVVAKLKEIADANPDEARRLLTQHPQLPEAILYCMSELDMIKTPVLGTAPPGLGIAPPLLLPTSVPPPSSASIVNKPVDPRAAARPPPAAVLPPPAPLPSDPRARDPRAAAAGGGAGVHPPNFPAPPPMMAPPGGGMPPPMTMPPPMAAGMQQGGAPSQQQLPGQLDPSLVQQVMALTPAQIAQLPPDKQQNILLLRQQITGGIMR